jgi:hypothetical protein
MASWARRPGRNPYEQGWKSASKIGSSTSLSAACTTRSVTVGMPSRRLLPPGLGINRSRAGRGRNLRAFSSARRSARKPSSPRTLLTYRAVRPSTPAVRAPLFPLTRRHATSRNAGSHTRLNRSSNRRPGSSVAQWCSLVWIPSTRASACSGVGHGASVFTSVLLAFQSLRCELAAALGHVAGFPDLGLLRRLRPTQAPTVDSGPARHRPGRPAGRAAPGRFPRSCCDRLTGRWPAVPQRPRHGYAADLPRGLLAGVNDRHQSRPQSRACAAARPISTRLEPVLPLRGFTALVPHVHLPVLLAEPGPSGSTDPSRRCRGCSHPPLHFQGRAAPSFTSLLRQAGGRALASLPDRITPRGAHSP